MSCTAKKDPNGTWHIQYRWTDWTGTKKKSQKRGFKTKKEAEEWYAHFMTQQAADPTMTFEDFWEVYKLDMEKRLRKTTMKQKEYIVKDKLLPYFGKTPINEISAPMIRKWQGELLQKGFKPTYLKTINNQLSCMFNYAVNFYDLRSNPCHKAGSMGKSKADERPFWTPEEFQKFSDAIIDKHDAWIGFQILFWTGIRLGELLALRVSDIDFENGTLTVDESYTRLDGEDLITPPKNESSIRVITIHKELQDKQLPPTSFFTSNRVDEENSEKEDLESLLDDCLAISMPQEHLKWHYRSRHESLIAYSNVKYYDNKLYTFPSPNDLVSEVKMVHLDGYYDKGKTKQNLAEAKAVVSEIVRRLRDERLRNDSIGVVTFSSVQQNLIEDLLLDEFSKHPELEEIDNKSKEPVFIKNLENVQGDERDIILFSIGYGPDKEGKVSMNFGPLNRDGGWRRLNVAISRARKSMIVYAVIKPEQIDLSRTRSEGVAGLKGFLEFAERGKNVLAVRSKSASTHVDTMINEIAEAIEKMGYKVKCNIGCSEYKMDIGVIHPNKENTYLLGILMDGENCREAATSKDRFMLQPNVLTGLGWKIMRVWMLEWLDNQAHVEKEIEKAIKEAIENDAVEKEAIDESNNQTQHLEFEKMDVSEISDSLKQPYQSVEISQIGMAEAFYGVDQKTRIRDKAKEILEKEAPISHKLLMRKVLSCWNISRSGSRVEGVFLGALDGVAKQSIKEGETLFYWKPSQNPMDYKGYRVEDQFGEKRSMEDVSSYEILNAILEVLTEQISLSQKDLVRETAKKFGFSRMGNVIETAVNGAINLGLEKEKISLAENGNVIIR